MAAWPPLDVCDALESIPRPVDRGVRYITRDQWHVTLRFLGTCDADVAARALAWLDVRPAVARCGPVVSHLGAEAVVVPVAGLDELAAAVVACTADVGEPPDPRPFTGHLTLARLGARAACGIAGAPFQATFAVHEVALVQSELGAHGVRYTTLATFHVEPDNR